MAPLGQNAGGGRAAPQWNPGGGIQPAANNWRDMGWQDSAGLTVATPMGGDGAGGTETPESINPEDYLEMLRNSPAAMAKLSPEVAATLQAYSANAANSAAQAKAQEALSAISGGGAVGSATGPPDVEGTLGGQFTDRYWAGKERQALAETGQAFDAQEQAIREQMRSGAMSAEGGRMALTNLELKRQSAMAARSTQLANRREEMTMALDQNRMSAQQARYGTAGPLELRREQARAAILRDWPQQVEAWTNIADWLMRWQRQTGRRFTGQPGGGGGGGGMPTLPVGDPGWNFGPVATSHAFEA